MSVSSHVRDLYVMFSTVLTVDRRKKSKCPGERPTCSYCERLGQLCVYESGSEFQGHRGRQDNSLVCLFLFLSSFFLSLLPSRYRGNSVSTNSLAYKELRMESLEEKLDFFMERLEYATEFLRQGFIRNVDR